MTRRLLLAFLSTALILQGNLSAEPKKVGPPSQEANNLAKRNKRIAIAAATVAVIVAVAVLLAVAHNHDHHHHGHHHRDHH